MDFTTASYSQVPFHFLGMNVSSRHGSIDTLRFEVNTYTLSRRQARVNVPRKVSTGFAFPLIGQESGKTFWRF